jgi:serine/threonine-protein kinase
VIQIGSVLGGKYKLVRLLGDGGMGSVYEAVHERLGTRVAIKILHADIARRPGIVDRFLQEAKVAAQIKSPHIVSVSDVDTTPDGLAYMVMDLLEGEPLANLVEREKKLPVPVAGAYTIQILEALEAAHAIGVVHRDLKPDNVFVTFVGQKPVLKLIDFGIAKVRREDGGNLTIAGVTMGTAEYMAPEQAFSADKADARSDVYSVGVMFYEMLSGQRPALGDNARAVATKVQGGEITPLIHAAPDTPQRIAGLVHRAMAPRPEMRFASATEMRLALEEALGTLPAPDKKSPLEPSKDPTLMTAPHQMAFANVPATTSTQRAQPIPQAAATPSFESTHRTPPLDVGFTPPPPAYTEHPRRRGSSMWIVWVGLALLLGAGAVVLIVMAQNNPDTPVVPTTTVPTVAPGDAVSTPTVATNEPIPTLHVTTTVPPSTGTRPTGDASFVRLDGGAPDGQGGTTSPFPSFNIPPFTLPDGSPFTIPSGLPTTFPPLFPPPQ